MAIKPFSLFVHNGTSINTSKVQVDATFFIFIPYPAPFNPLYAIFTTKDGGDSDEILIGGPIFMKFKIPIKTVTFRNIGIGNNTGLIYSNSLENMFIY